MDPSRHELLIWLLRGCFAVAFVFCFGYSVRNGLIEWKIRKIGARGGDTAALKRAKSRGLVAYVLMGAILIACVWIGPKIGWDG